MLPSKQETHPRQSRRLTRAADAVKALEQKLVGAIFFQHDSFWRICTLRWLVAGIVLLSLVANSHPAFYAGPARSLFSPVTPLIPRPLAYGPFLGLEISVAVFAILGFTGVGGRLTNYAMATSYIVFHSYISGFGFPNLAFAHLPVFVLLLSIARPNPTIHANPKDVFSSHIELNSFVLTCMQSYIAMAYLQAGISKLLYGGVGWFTSGKTLFYYLVFNGTHFGKFLTGHPSVFPIAGIMTGLFEFGAFFGLLIPRSRQLTAVIAIVFHLATYTIMGISFWPLWFLYPAVFHFSKFYKNQ